jgi:hypothetical protein
MPSTWAPANAPSTATSGSNCQPASGEFAQLELPLHREADVRRGSYFRNCRFSDAIRRSVVKRLPHGAVAEIAAMLDQFNERPKVLARVYDEHAGTTRFSLDVFVADLLHLTTDDARHVLQKIAKPLGLWVLRAPGTGEDSAA